MRLLGLQNAGPWQAEPILVSGATAYRDGEFLYQDFLYDDHGAVGAQDPSDPFNGLREQRRRPRRAARAARRDRLPRDAQPPRRPGAHRVHDRARQLERAAAVAARRRSQVAG